MIMRFPHTFLTLLLIAIAAPACGDDATGSSAVEPTAVDSGLDGGLVLSEATEDDIAALCALQTQAQQAFIQIVDPCLLSGIMAPMFAGMTDMFSEEDSAEPPSCQELVDECQASDEIDPTSEPCDESAFTDCGATIAEYEACTDAALAAAYEGLRNVSCETDLGTVMMSMASQPDECAVLEQKGCRQPTLASSESP